MFLILDFKGFFISDNHLLKSLSKEPNPKIKHEILDKMSGLIVAAFGLVAALAWNDLITTLFAQVFGAADSIIPMIVYALIVTVFAVVLTIVVSKASSRAKSIMQQKTFQCSLCSFHTKVESKLFEHNVKQHAANQDKFFMK